MSAHSVTRLLSALMLLAAAACSDLREHPPNAERTDGKGGSAGNQSTGGRGGSGGSNDAPVADTAGGLDVEQGPDMGGPCNAGATRCAGSVVEVCTVAGA